MAWPGHLDAVTPRWIGVSSICNSCPQGRRGLHAAFRFYPVTFGHGTSSGASFELKGEALHVVCEVCSRGKLIRTPFRCDSFHVMFSVLL